MIDAPAKDEPRPRMDRALRVLLPIVVLALGILVWELVVHVGNIPPYVLPGPWLVFSTLVSDWAILSAALVVTLVTTLQGFLLAVVGGVGLAVLFNQSRVIEYSLYPYAVILQVTPVVAIAPLLLVYLPQPAAVLACAWIVAFFPCSPTPPSASTRSTTISSTCSASTVRRGCKCCGSSSCRRRCPTSWAA